MWYVLLTEVYWFRTMYFICRSDAAVHVTLCELVHLRFYCERKFSMLESFLYACTACSIIVTIGTLRVSLECRFCARVPSFDSLETFQ